MCIAKHTFFLESAICMIKMNCRRRFCTVTRLAFVTAFIVFFFFFVLVNTHTPKARTQPCYNQRSNPAELFPWTRKCLTTWVIQLLQQVGSGSSDIIFFLSCLKAKPQIIYLLKAKQIESLNQKKMFQTCKKLNSREICPKKKKKKSIFYSKMDEK